MAFQNDGSFGCSKDMLKNALYFGPQANGKTFVHAALLPLGTGEGVEAVGFVKV